MGGGQRSRAGGSAPYDHGIPLFLKPASRGESLVYERTRAKNGTPIPENNQCPVCHSGPHYTNQHLADVGSGKTTDRSPLFDVPQLTNVYLTAPYLHDGSARSLEEIWTVPTLTTRTESRTTYRRTS